MSSPKNASDFFSDRSSAKIMCDDPRLCYEMVPTPCAEELQEMQDVVPGCGICSNSCEVEFDKYDYLVPLTQEDKETTKHTHPLPLSFLQIREGDVEAGIGWYKHHYPKVPDELIEIMARYNFGDLKYATRKSIKNSAKKFKKKQQQQQLQPLQTKGLTVKKDAVSFVFG